MTHRLFAIGPLNGTDAARGRIAYFLFPGLPEQPSIFGNGLAEVLPRFLAGVDPADILAEPALKEDATALGLAVAPLDGATRSLLGGIALDIALPGAFAEVRDDALIDAFAEAARDYAAVRPETWAEPFRTLRLDWDAAGPTQTARVTQGPGLAILDADGGDPDDPAAFDGLGMVFAPGEAALCDALGRAYGLNAVPEPFRLRAGEKQPVDDPDLACLTAALMAVAALPLRPGATSRGAAEMDGGTGCAVTARHAATVQNR
ncbi:hypothetical protein QO034_10460 [Sedimentitalea sp. JM2-8]|uniref:Uncharacterized protein n=1 Tax=Sedimentitalea xiamensis TaxID=3050037 RepID=A0ABT7FEI8_9RHOB|nr:hypothetical protein [Sedimentitalea xiamensis]MDK3073534.1 hypothetical protein [Sedimentitalea xiamensis]